MRTALTLFSAGQDSATCLAWALERFDRVCTIGFDYGQRHRIELDQRPLVLAGLRALRPAWSDRLGDDLVIDIRSFGALAESALTADREIAMAENGLPTTFVPGRNLVFLAYAAAHAFRIGAETLIGGMCETDYSGYPDCRRETLDAMERALSLGLGAPVAVETPLMHLTKAQTWALAESLGGAALVELIRLHTHTCYNGDRSQLHAWGYGCGACPACDLRAVGWTEYAAGRAP
jgi:7-cyano-7-deazaguanine synthase